MQHVNGPRRGRWRLGQWWLHDDHAPDLRARVRVVLHSGGVLQRFRLRIRGVRDRGYFFQLELLERPQQFVLVELVGLVELVDIGLSHGVREHRRLPERQ